MSVLCLIPARKNSVGVPDKNLRTVGGLSLILRAIRIAKSVDRFDCIAISSDDPRVLALAEKEGVRAIERPAELAGRWSKVEESVAHALDHMAASEPPMQFETICLFEPTSPLRTVETVRSCLEKYYRSSAKALMTIVPVVENIGRLDQDGMFRAVDPHGARLRQEREPLFKEAGVVYLRDVDDFRSNPAMLPADGCITHLVSDVEGLDINEPVDLVIANALAGQQETDTQLGSIDTPN